MAFHPRASTEVKPPIIAMHVFLKLYILLWNGMTLFIYSVVFDQAYPVITIFDKQMRTTLF